MRGSGLLLARAAADHVGTPFRMGGRERATGVDCVGLVVVSLQALGREVAPLPHYSLRQTDIGRFLTIATNTGLLACVKPLNQGDILLLRPSPAQWHLAIYGEDTRTIIHAHAGLRRVTKSWLPEDWPIERSWRLD